MIKNAKLLELNTKIAGVSLNAQNFKGNSIKYKRLCCNQNYQKKFDENLKKRFFKICKFSNYDINKFILLLQKVVYPMNTRMIGKNLIKLYYTKKKTD